ncbi:unnamed protein product [Polarella glacialis]|uniref:Uncharacterized protein n=1 Tax=Polarella glacialis TaxID=89957 RepID=A0A813K069_POLGL|nr:unnamed protein product [Polarella glacialis]
MAWQQEFGDSLSPADSFEDALRRRATSISDSDHGGSSCRAETDSFSDAGTETETEGDCKSSKLLCHQQLELETLRWAAAQQPQLTTTTTTKSRTRRDAARLLATFRESPTATLVSGSPRVLCVARRHRRKDKFVDFVGEYHLDLIQEFGGAPVIVPRTAKTMSSLLEYLPMDGLLVVEGNDISDDVLRKYHCSVPERLDEEEATRFASDTEFDVSKDELECALMRYALSSGCPILGMCRGAQLLNALRGGTLIGDIGAEVGHQIEHLRDSSDPTYDSFRHPIHVSGKTPLAEMFADSLDLLSGGELMVNSLSVFQITVCCDLLVVLLLFAVICDVNHVIWAY